MKLHKSFYIFIIGLELLSFSAFGQKQKDSISILDSVNILNFSYYQSITKNPLKSLNYSKEAFSYLKEIESDKLRLKVTINFATALFVNERYKKALAILDEIKVLELNDSSKALYYTLRGLVENDLNHISQSEALYKKALELYIKLGDKDNEFTILNNLGLLYNNIGDYKRSLEIYLKCYDIISDLKIKIDRYKYYMNIGTVSYNLNDYNSALGAYTKAFEDAKINGDTIRIYRTYEKMGQTNLELNKLDIALKNYKEALKGYKQLGLNKEECNILLRLGDIYYLKNNKEAAFKHYNECQKISFKYSFSQEYYQASLNIGVYYQNLFNFKKAQSYYKKIIQNQSQIINLEILKEAFNGLYQIEKPSNNALLSLEYLENYLKYDTDIRKRQLATQNEQIEIRYNLIQKEQDLENLEVNFALNELKLKNKQQQIQSLIVFSILIVLALLLILRLYFQNKKVQKLLSKKNEKINFQNEKLASTNTEIKAQRKELTSLNKIKDQLLSVIAHDVKSPMTDLYNLLFILRNNLNALSIEDLKENLAIIESSTSNLLNLLNNVLNWIISQSSGVEVKISSFSLNELININLKLVESSMIAKDLTITFSPNKKIDLFKSDLNIIDFALRNILSNAVKFTNKKGTIHLELQKLPNDQIEIRIADSGIGFSEEIHTLLKENRERVPVTSGTNTEKGYGIGLSLCKKMLAKIDSQIIYEKNEPSGSIFILQLSPMQL